MPDLDALFDLSPSTFAQGGTRTYVDNLAAAMAEIAANHDVRIQFSNVPPKLLPTRDKGLIHKIRVLAWESYYLQYVLSRRADGFDVLHAPALRFPIAFKGRLVVTLLDVIPLLMPHLFRRRDLPLFRLYYSLVRKHADHIIAISEQSRLDIHRLLEIPLERITVTPLGVLPCFRPVDADDVDKVLQKYDITRPYILTVGTLEPRKNLGRTLQAFAMLGREEPHVHQLVVVGPPGWHQESVMRIAAQLDISALVRVTGQVPQEHLPALYSGAACFVYPTLWEGFGLPALEAMACGCPVMTSNCSSLPEVVGPAGLLIDPYDVLALRDAMVRLLSDLGFAQHLKTQGLERARAFTWQRCAEQTLGVYRRVAST